MHDVDDLIPMHHHEEVEMGKVRSRRPAVLQCLHAIDARRLQERRSWVVSFSILGPFGPRRATAMLRTGDHGRDAARHPVVPRRAHDLL